MCALRAHNSKPILEKVLTTFSIPKKTFPKMDLLMYVLRAYVNRTHLYICYIGQNADNKQIESYLVSFLVQSSS